VPSQQPNGPYLEAIQRAFRFARETGRDCGPAEFLVGISEGRGPAAAALDPGAGLSLRAMAADADHPAGQGYLHMQAQGAARSLADTLGQPPGPEHLLIALLDQGTPEVAGLLRRAGLDPGMVRRAALAAIGAPAGYPPLPLPPLTPPGTLDRPPLPVADLDARAWAVLRWRQDHLPLSRLRRDSDRQALAHLEEAAAWQVADRLGLDDDQCYSLISHHGRQVGQLAGRPPTPRRRGPRPRRFPAVPVGWAAWFGNRRTGLRDRWFRLRTIGHYRGCPQP
jgi:Clp amino terminal domain, pathogenicity island component